MRDNIVLKNDPYTGRLYQINYALNYTTFVNLRHRRVEQHIYSYAKARFRMASPLYGCFLSKCIYNDFKKSCDVCFYHYIKEIL